MKEIMNLVFEVFLFMFQRDFLHVVKCYYVGPTALLPLRRK
jgi:hypothetical protein